MYSLPDIIDAIRNPYKIVREMNVLYHTRLHYHNYNPDGVDVLKEDWDNLILLDACRYEEFKDYHTLPGKLEKRESRGTHSREFVRGNFTDRKAHDTVVVSANGYYKKLAEDHNIDLHDMIIVLEDEEDRPTDWPEVYRGRVIPPQAVTEKAIEAAERYPNKRLIVHYMQPHKPYIGPEGVEKFGEVPEPLWASMRSGEYDVTDEDLHEVYVENLNIVLEEVEVLMDELVGKTVVSGDHGELLGENQFPLPISTYGHPQGVYIPELTQVPWLEYEDGPRKEIISEEPSGTTEVSEDEMEKVDERLEKLGYKV